MIITLPTSVKKIISTLEAAGFEAFAVGGCVRDSILGRVPNDWDITTSASPSQVKRLFKKTIDTGIQHGTVTVLENNEGFEVTTYRIDGVYEDSRHPKDVTFTSSLEEDLARRDFTINAMAYNDSRGLVDLYDGIGDIEKKLIKAVGNPIKRFEEDALRMLRAVRFAAQLGYQVDESTQNAIKLLSPNLKAISAERIQTELVKLVISNHPDFLRMAYATGITSVILPEFDKAYLCEQNNPHHKYNVGEHCLQAMLYTPSDKVLRLTMLFHDLGKPDCKTTDELGINHFHGHAAISEKFSKDIFNRLKFDNDTKNKVSKLVFYHDYNIQQTERGVRRALNKIGEDLFPLLLEVKKADALAQSSYKREEKLKAVDTINSIYSSVLSKQQCVSLKTLAITGSDLIDAGIKPGKEIGKILNSMLEHVIDYPEDNNKEILLDLFLK